MTKKPDVTVETVSDDEIEDMLEITQVKQAGAEEKAALLDAFKNGRVIFTSEVEAEMKEMGLSVEDIIRDLESAIKKDLN